MSDETREQEIPRETLDNCETAKCHPECADLCGQTFHQDGRNCTRHCGYEKQFPKTSILMRLQDEFRDDPMATGLMREAEKLVRLREAARELKHLGHTFEEVSDERTT